MGRLFTLLALMGMASIGYSKANMRDVQLVYNEVTDLVNSADGIEGDGIKFKCRQYQWSRTVEPCYFINARTPQAKRALEQLFPQGTRFKGVLIQIENIGGIVR